MVQTFGPYWLSCNPRSTSVDYKGSGPHDVHTCMPYSDFFLSKDINCNNRSITGKTRVRRRVLILIIMIITIINIRSYSLYEHVVSTQPMIKVILKWVFMGPLFSKTLYTLYLYASPWWEWSWGCFCICRMLPLASCIHDTRQSTGTNKSFTAYSSFAKTSSWSLAPWNLNCDCVVETWNIGTAQGLANGPGN